MFLSLSPSLPCLHYAEASVTYNAMIIRNKNSFYIGRRRCDRYRRLGLLGDFRIAATVVLVTSVAFRGKETFR